MIGRLETHLGVWRSLLIYYGNPLRQRRMAEFYGQFVSPGSLCFDVGAHVGSRLRPLLKLGARVVALEPQPQLMRVLERLYGDSPNLVLRQEAAGAAPGVATLLSSRANPTVATLSADWIAAISHDSSFAGVRWEPAEEVSVTTLDQLIERYGRPDYIKIDVEGFELEALRGLNQPVPLISYEYIPAAIDRAAACVERLSQLGDYEFNWFEGESHRWQSPHWLDPATFRGALRQLGTAGRSGDIFARCRSVA